MTSPLLEGKKGIILGVANKRSIAWAITQAAAAAGARIALTYQGPRLEENVRKLAENLDDPVVLPCDVSEDQQVEDCFRRLGEEMGSIDFLVHCIAFANREDLAGEFLDTSREGYRIAQEVSSYSLTLLARAAAPLLEKDGGGSIVALTYLGSERVVPHYNVMGVAKAALESSIRYLASDLGKRDIRVNGISAGPISTLSARGISGFTKVLEVVRDKAPLHRNTDPAEVADTALFLLSRMSRGITGEILFVDGGFHIMGM
ncbi:MAG: enoyl-ACP reductase [Acidobacteriota bacterium]